MHIRTTPEQITHLEPNQVFVFGSNDKAIHGKGAAKQALRWGAKIGKPGYNGQTYGIITRQYFAKDDVRTLPLREIARHVMEFTRFAAHFKDMQFLVTAVGTGNAGYFPEDIAPLFVLASVLDNVWLPESFWRVIS